MDFKRQIDIYNPDDFNLPVTIVGVGNIGSQAALALGRLGIRDLTVYDHDIVEIHNLSSQSYFLDHLDKPKVDAVKQQVENINSDALVLAKNKKYEGEGVGGEILVIAVDSMEERKTIHGLLKSAIEKDSAVSIPSLIIDARVGGPQLEIYTVHTMDEWEATFSDNPDHDPCGARYICYISMVVGALIANQIKRVLKGEKYKKEVVFNIDSLDIIKT